ncbi:hypothetical protein BDV12DRAFT_138576 [Aspergillus spectabilis]
MLRAGKTQTQMSATLQLITAREECPVVNVNPGNRSCERRQELSSQKVKRRLGSEKKNGKYSENPDSTITSHFFQNSSKLEDALEDARGWEKCAVGCAEFGYSDKARLTPHCSGSERYHEGGDRAPQLLPNSTFLIAPANLIIASVGSFFPWNLLKIAVCCRLSGLSRLCRGFWTSSLAINLGWYGFDLCC